MQNYILIINQLQKFAVSYYTVPKFVEHSRFSFTHDFAYHFPVGFHHVLRVDGGKIDLCGLQVFVAQPLADDGQAGAHVTHRAGPGMPPRICRQGCMQSALHAPSFQQFSSMGFSSMP